MPSNLWSPNNPQLQCGTFVVGPHRILRIKRNHAKRKLTVTISSWLVNACFWARGMDEQGRTILQSTILKFAHQKEKCDITHLCSWTAQISSRLFSIDDAMNELITSSLLRHRYLYQAQATVDPPHIWRQTLYHLRRQVQSAQTQ